MRYLLENSQSSTSESGPSDPSTQDKTASTALPAEQEDITVSVPEPVPVQSLESRESCEGVRTAECVPNGDSIAPVAVAKDKQTRSINVSSMDEPSLGLQNLVATAKLIRTYGRNNKAGTGNADGQSHDPSEHSRSVSRPSVEETSTKSSIAVIPTNETYNSSVSAFAIQRNELNALAAISLLPQADNRYPGKDFLVPVERYAEQQIETIRHVTSKHPDTKGSVTKERTPASTPKKQDTRCDSQQDVGRRPLDEKASKIKKMESRPRNVMKQAGPRQSVITPSKATAQVHTNSKRHYFLLLISTWLALLGLEA